MSDLPREATPARRPTEPTRTPAPRDEDTPILLNYVLLLMALLLGLVLCSITIGEIKNGATSFLVNVISSAAWTLILLAMIFAYPLYAELTTRRQMRRFFGVSNGLIIYLSDIFIEKGGTRPLELMPGYAGPAVCRIEYSGALLVREELGRKRLPVIPKLVYDVIGRYTVEYSETKTKIHLSWLPKKTAEFRAKSETLEETHWIWSKFEESVFWANLDNSGPILIIGSDVYNSMTKYYLQVYAKLDENVAFYSGFPDFVSDGTNDHREIVFNHYTGDHSECVAEARSAQDFFRGTPGSESQPPTEPAFIARFKDRGLAARSDVDGRARGLVLDQFSSAVGRTVIICAGVSDESTSASVRYLLANWPALSDEFANDDFVVMLRYEKWGGFEGKGNKDAVPEPEVAEDIKLGWIKRRNTDTYRLHIRAREPGSGPGHADSAGRRFPLGGN